MAIKTLLVGLGGTGCEIVTRVRNLIHEADDNVQFVGLDTDGNWGGVDGLPIIYTSREMTVKQYLRDVDNWRDWFPDNPSIMFRNMIKGAGQIRALSRLAFAETIASNRIGVLRDAIKALKVSRGDIEPSNFRIMIISSFAGGTGSGMFLQTAVFLRDFIRREYGGEVIIRGLFALPDIFMGGNPSKIQQESMYANAYASIKELNAMNRVTLSSDASADEIQMTIDSLFDSKRDRGRAEKKPFDFIFFVDNINSRSMVMSSIEEYKRLMTTAAYMQVYSPITDSGDSREDNAILTVISEDGRPLYGSVGASQIVYPYRDLVNYCGLRATIDSISELWTLIDDEFKAADRENQQMMELDPNVKPLDRGAHYQATMKSLLEGGNNRLNFIHRATTETAEDGKVLDRAETFYDAVFSFVTDKIRNDDEVRSRENSVGVTEKHMKSKSIVSYVVRNETALKDYLETVNDRVMLLRSSLVMSIIPDDLSKPLNTDTDWNIMRLVKPGQGVVHPMAIRTLLYHLRDLIRQEHAASMASANAAIKAIRKYFESAYDLESTEDQVESAAYRAGQKGRNQQQFRTEYLQKSNEQKTRIDKYRDDKVRSEVFGAVLTRLNALIQQFERLFDSLEDIQAEMQHEVEILETKKHSNTADSAIYLCASQEEKQDLYDSLNFRCSDSNDNNVYDSIFYSLYAAAMEVVELERNNRSLRQKKNLKGTRAEQKDRVAVMDKIFRDSILARNTDDIEKRCADRLDIDVYQALRQATEDDRAEMRALLDKAHDKALPYLMTSLSRKIVSLSESGDGDDDCAYTLVFWGIHPEVEQRVLDDQGIGDIKPFFKAGTSGYEPEVVSDEEYSRYEISCYQALYCVSLSEIPKFTETGDAFGVYYENYSKRITKILKRDKLAINPHLDIRWHQRSYLPMINDAKNREDDENTARAIWLALIYGGLPEELSEDGRALYASFARVVGSNAMIEEKYPKRDIRNNGRPVSLSNPYELYKALQVDELTVSRFLEVYSKSLEEDCEQDTRKVEFTGPRARIYAKNLISEKKTDRNALNIAARFLGHRKASETEKSLFVRALEDLLNEVSAELSAARKKELRQKILAASRFGKNQAEREKVRRYINFDFWDSQS